MKFRPKETLREPIARTLVGSDAEAKGVKPGDEILQAGGYEVNRASLWKIQYLYNTLRPQPGIHVVLRTPSAQVKEIDLLAKQKQGQRVKDLTDYNVYMDMVRKEQREAQLGRDRYVTFGEQQLCVWRMNEFDLTETQVDDAMSKAKKFKTLILDLRGNSGGFLTTITRMISNLFDHDVKIADSKSRKQSRSDVPGDSGAVVLRGSLRR
jgi:C-terminal processing protease CtpA/Prc